ncbi:MAG: hypothetical protein IKK10_03140 [Clostridia bacterium]|nr:hypothetical protein [Clostridia bacterium]
MKEKNVDYVVPVVKKEKDSAYYSAYRKKKRFRLFNIIAIAVIVVSVLLVLIFAPKSIDGDWELVVNPEISQATDDEIEDSQRVYYTFTKPGDFGDGKYKTYYNGGVEEGEYKLSEKDGKALINLGTEDLEYKITGLKFLGNTKLIITYPEYTNEQTGQKIPAEDYVFAQAKAPKYEKESYDSFDTDNKLMGKWKSNDRTLEYYMYELSYTQTVEFINGGIMVIHYESTDLALDRYMYYAYTAKDNELTFSLVTDKETKYTVSYDFDEKGNLKFINDTTAGSIFADAFFGDFTFYSPENLPEPEADSNK